METLELKHLAPYLPYKLKGKYTLSDVINLRDGQKDEIRDKKLEAECVPFFLLYCKPILRPLSDLTKERIDFLWFEVIGVDRGNFDKHDFYEKCEIGLINLLPIMVYEKLLEWHFNVFDLPQDLWIDINTLNK